MINKKIKKLSKKRIKKGGYLSIKDRIKDSILSKEITIKKPLKVMIEQAYKLWLAGKNGKPFNTSIIKISILK